MYAVFDIEHPFLFAPQTDRVDAVLALSRPDLVRLIGILIRARRARSLGITIPIETLLAGEPL